MSIAGVKTVVSAFSDARADYDMSRASRFVRRRTGVAPTGAGEDWNYRAEIKYYQDIEQARDMDRNDGLVGCLADRRVDNIVQQGFTLDTKTGDKALDQDLWQRWQAFASDPEACDIAGEMTFHEMERHVCRSESIDGDIVGLGTEDGPLQIHEGHAIQTSSKVENTFLGVTRDKYGRREQYHFRYDLNEFGQKSESEPIDVRNSEGVRQLFHVYNPKRVSATRGVTQLAPVFSLSGMLEDINFAKLVQQQIVSCFAILAEKAVGSNGNLPNVDGRSQFGEPATENTGSDTRQLEGISPGMFYRGKEGEKLTGFSPNVPNSEYFQQVKLILQIVGVNFGLPLCLVLMDGSETNFSGWRGAVDEARKGFVADQLNLVRRWHSPVYRWWLHREMAMEPILQRAAERKGIDIFGHTWQLPTWSYIEPVADAEGDTAQLRNALTSPRRMHAARGKDWETIAEEIIDDNVYAIEKAQAKADKHNQKFPQAPPLSWRDLIPLPMPEGQTLAMQDPNAIAAQEEQADEPPAVKPVARKKKQPRADRQFDENEITRDEDGKFSSGGGNSGKVSKAKQQATGPFVGGRNHINNSGFKSRQEMESTMSNALASAPALSDYEIQERKKAVQAVVSKLPEFAIEHVGQTVKIITACGGLGDVSKQFTDITGQSVDEDDVIGGLWSTGSGRLTVNGGFEDEGYVDDEKTMTKQGIFAHEIGHVLDTVKGKFTHSNSPDFSIAFEKEIANGQLSEYASTDRQEGFAEFARLVYGSDVESDEIEKNFPITVKFFKSIGLM